MNRMNLVLIVVNVLLFNLNLIGFFHLNSRMAPQPQREQAIVRPSTPLDEGPAPAPEVEVKPNISFVVPNGDMKFQEIVTQLARWNKEAPQITEIGVVGKTQNGTEIPYIRIGKKTGPKLLITACIHGNEHLCCSVSMGVMGKLLSNYMVDEEVTKLLRERDIYYIPVVSPESYMLVARHDMGIDPNRNFNGPNLSDKKSIPSVQALRDFQTKHKFKSAMSCHNFARVYFYPWGYAQRPTDKDADYKRILGMMSQATGYKYEQLLRQSAPPYYGYEADWFYSQGAFSIVNEIGRNFQATPSEVQTETEINYKAFKIWIRESPLVR